MLTITKRLKGFRTFVFAFFVTLETLLEPLLIGGEVSWDRIWLIVAFAILRTITSTAPGRKE